MDDTVGDISVKTGDPRGIEIGHGRIPGNVSNWLV
jgi:hypothetical protein